RFQIRIWKNDIDNAFGAESNRTHAELLNSMKSASDKLLVFLKDKPCKDNAQAQELEKYLHERFHELYGRVVADIKHGVNTSCSRDHKLVPTLWITDYLPKSSKTTYAEAAAKAAATKADAAKADDTAERERAEVNKVLNVWSQEIRGSMPFVPAPNLTE